MNNWYRLNALLDTGALFPVWTAPEEALISIGAAKIKENVPYHIILSATMFHNLIYEIDIKNHKLNIIVPDDESTVRNLRIEDTNGKLHILCQ